MFIEVPKFMSLLTVSGTATGTVTVTDYRGFHVGAHAWLKGTVAAPKEYIIVSITPTTGTAATITLRNLPNAGSSTTNSLSLNAVSYGLSDVSAYTTGDGAILSIAQQIVRVEPDWKRFGGLYA